MRTEVQSRQALFVADLQGSAQAAQGCKSARLNTSTEKTPLRKSIAMLIWHISQGMQAVRPFSRAAVCF